MLLFSDMEAAGFLPMFLDENDPRDAVTQLDANYQHGGGWSEFEGCTVEGWTPGRGGAHLVLISPGDNRFKEWSRATFRDQTIVVFDCSFVLVIRLDGTFNVARMD